MNYGVSSYQLTIPGCFEGDKTVTFERVTKSRTGFAVQMPRQKLNQNPQS